nr:RNA-directed DNA polymerase, eukaryota, reverse transcriptase zinc-binding domain protein [Tanacetum cinerariifolium]
MKYRENLEIEKYGRFGMLPKQEALNLQPEITLKMIKEKCYNIHQDLISVKEKLDKGLLRFPDCKKLNKFHEKFKENTTGIDNDDTTESGNSDLQSMKNKERNEAVDHILNEDDKVDDSCPTTGFCSYIERDEVKFTEVEDVEKEKQQIGYEDDRVVDDSVFWLKMFIMKRLNAHLKNKKNVKKPVSVVEKIVADTLFAMIGSKLDLTFESQSGLGLNHLEMETLTPTLMVSTYVRVIHAIHGVDGRIGRAENVGYTSVWCDIIKEMDRLASHGIDLISMMHKKIGNRLNTSFWEDRWRGEQQLKEVFLRIYALEVNKHISVAFKFEQTSLSSSFCRMPRSGIESEQWDHLLDSLEGVMLNTSEDRWSWVY